jgi:hypothetical protein
MLFRLVALLWSEQLTLTPASRRNELHVLLKTADICACIASDKRSCQAASNLYCSYTRRPCAAASHSKQAVFKQLQAPKVHAGCSQRTQQAVCWVYQEQPAQIACGAGILTLSSAAVPCWTTSDR